MPTPEPELLNSIVSRVFRVEDVTLGEPARGLIARYRGRLLSDDTVGAYDQLDAALRPYNITPLFRMDKGQQVIYLTPRPPAPKPARAWVNVVLFILTVMTVMWAGADAAAFEAARGVLGYVAALLTGWPYALSLMAILLAHEFGHYLMSRHHNTQATLPYFIPLPLPPLGTLGAAIMMQGTPKNKRVLFDIGVAGPLAGMVVAIPVLLLGLSLSHVDVIRPIGGSIGMEGNSLLYLLAKYTMFGKLLPAPVALPAGLTEFGYWLRYFFTGRPIPVGATDVMLSPVAFAGWAGLLVTALNLIPAGTLDGGHVVYSWFGERASKAFPFIFLALLALGIAWQGWWLWAALLWWLGRVHAEPLDQITKLDAPRIAIAAVTILIFILTFSPVPFSVFTGL